MRRMNTASGSKPDSGKKGIYRNSEGKMGYAAKVSVIMPSLNVAPFMRECLESVSKQTLKEIEIICVDAGSTDGTQEIIRSLQEKDARIQLIVSDKKSYGYQMNLGLAAAHGEYIGIVETDDWAESEMFEQLYAAAKSHDADVVKSNYYWYYTQPETVNKPFENLRGCPYNTVFSPEDEPRIFSVTPSIWSGIYRKSLLDTNRILFNETPGASFQDTSFHFMVFTAAQRVLCLDRYFLHYRRDNADSSVYADGKVFCVSDEMHFYEAFLDRYPDQKAKLLAPYIGWKYEKYRWNFERLSPRLQWSFLDLFRREFQRHRADSLLNPKYLSVDTLHKINLLIDRPLAFFSDYGKIYATRPSRTALPPAQIVRNSRAIAPDVSVIIPSYNSATDLRRSIDSVRQQTLTDLEIVCVDDGSSDETLSVLLELADTDDRITVIHQVNLGQGAARNEGLLAAKGRYVQFLDADDALTSDACAALVETADAENLDILYFDGRTIFETSDLEVQNPYYLHAYEYKVDMPVPITGKQYFNMAIEAKKYRASACMSLFKRSFLLQNDVRFPIGIFQEDNLFTFTAMLSAQRVRHVEDVYYLRTLKNGSIMTSKKVFQHFYGYFYSAMQMMETASRFPYEQPLYGNIQAELLNLVWHAKDVYLKLDNIAGSRSKLTEIERLFLDRFVLGANSGNAAQQELNHIKKSYSYRIGRFLTAPLRKVYNLFHCLKKNGFSYTVHKYYSGLFGGRKEDVRPLFVSSDAFKMSGAFLSMLALNKALNTELHIPTKVILPYHGSGNELVKSAGIAHQVIGSTDWIVPIGVKKDLRFYAQKYNEHTENLYAAVRIAREALKNNYNLIHSNSTYTYVGFMASRIAGMPHIWHLREFLEEDQSKEIYCKQKGYRMLARSDRTVVISRALYQKYASIVPEDRLRLIYNGIAPEKYYLPDRAIFREDAPVFLFVSGSEAPEKGRKTLIDACALLKKAGFAFSLRFVGWCGIELQEQVAEAGLTENTRFYGYQKNTEEFYREADIFFMCSKFEAFGRTTAEAMMAGCLVIGADTAGTAELIDDQKTGLLYPYGDAAALAERIRYALLHREKTARMAAAGQAYTVRHFTAAANAEAVADLYRQMSDSVQKQGKILRWLHLRKADLIAVRCKLRRHTVGVVCRKLCKPKPQAKETAAAVETTGASPNVSVIVPVYNVEAYLRQCLDSIVGQTMKNMEIICVNDGSTDRSRKILAEYAAKDGRIILIDKENSGYGASMNRGLQAATGEYVAFVETDDFLDPHMMEDLYALAIERGRVDIVKSAYWLYYDTEDGKGEVKDAPILAACHPPKPVFDVWTYPEIIYHHPSIWSCLYKRAFLHDKNIRFTEAKGAGWVDNPFLIETFCQAKTVAWTPKAYYCYRQTNPGASSFLKDCSIPFERTAEVFAFLEKRGIMDQDILGSVYKRVLWNAAAVMESPYFQPEKDTPIIVNQLQKVPPAFLTNERVQEKERKAYLFFKGSYKPDADRSDPPSDRESEIRSKDPARRPS